MEIIIAVILIYLAFVAMVAIAGLTGSAMVVTCDLIKRIWKSNKKQLEY